MSDVDLTPALQRLEDRLDQRLSCVEEKLDKVRTEDIPSIRVDVAREISALKAKAGWWGLIAGAFGSLAAALIYFVAK
jgi:hypothetical protein